MDKGTEAAMENFTTVDYKSKEKTGGCGCTGCMLLLAVVAVVLVLSGAIGKERMKRLVDSFDWLGDILVLGPLVFLAAFLLVAYGVVIEGKKGGPAPLRIVGGLLIAYGATGFFLPASASMILPHRWQWPVEREARALALTDGMFAVQANGGRVQIYNRDGNYRTGWFAPTYSKGFSMQYAPGAGLRVLTGSEIILYDFEGNVRSRQEVSRFAKHEFADGPYELRIMDTQWWLLPLTWPPYGFMTGIIGGLVIAASSWLGRRRYPAGKPPK